MFTYQKTLFVLAIKCFQDGLLIYQNNVEESLRSLGVWKNLLWVQWESKSDIRKNVFIWERKERFYKILLCLKK